MSSRKNYSFWKAICLVCELFTWVNFPIYFYFLEVICFSHIVIELFLAEMYSKSELQF